MRRMSGRYPGRVAAMTTSPVEVDLNRLYAGLNAELQPCINMVSFGLRAAAYGEVPDEPHTRMPGTNMEFRTGTKPPDSVLRPQFEAWVLTGGLRDAVEVVSVFLEHARFTASFFRLCERLRTETGNYEPGGEAEMSPQDYEQLVVTEQKKFHRLGFPDKLGYLRTQYPVALAPDLGDKVLTINQARNCFVHRRGVVSERDTNCEDGLQVCWNTMTPYLVSEHGKVKLEPPPAR